MPSPADLGTPRASRSCRPLSYRAGALLVAVAACARVDQPPAPRPTAGFDVLLRGGTVVDGTGRPAYRADVGIVGGHIAAIGDLAASEGATTIDVRGLLV